MTENSDTLAAMRGEVGDTLPQTHIDYLAADGEIFANYLAWRGFVLDDGALTKAQKLLMVVALLVANRDLGPLELYATQSISEGATRDELKEALRVGVLFSGGPGVDAAASVSHLLRD